MCPTSPTEKKSRKYGMKDQNHKMSLKRSMDFHEIRLKWFMKLMPFHRYL